ncbi:MAG TPA: type II toxin-antitoxin system HicB family antitoxin [Ferruginibacter sp.]|jgi:predicted HicB family RNase H-like nuclease|nr:toxin-antitoxin system HicB family antitoxin [Chitinophagaceae bacterium]HML57407.1 type II toxin-antitoxin system HicB family antitoxin [Ferruginibacter sp.]HRN92834.1 type II toxin-antitoxin system HicB family antitoxin [Ferruginibacter sp.]HRP50535.1 type II toxin-antitoxin system HicB family antitoxin [Ferruginibacter sp.]
MNDILQYKGYYADIHFSADDEIFFGKLIGINDLVNFEADSVKGLKKAFKEAVDDYLETCKELKKEPNKTYKGSFNVRIPSELHKQAAIFAALKKITLNDFVRYAIDLTISTEKGSTDKLKHQLSK